MKKKVLFMVSLFAVALFTVALAQAPQSEKATKAKTECCQKAKCAKTCDVKCENACGENCEKACGCAYADGKRGQHPRRHRIPEGKRCFLPDDGSTVSG